MTGARLVRTSGTLLVVGGLVFGLMELVTALAFPGDTAAQAKEPLWTPSFALVAVGTMMLLFGAPALFSRIAAPGGWMGQAGLIMIAVAGMALGVGGNIMQAFFVPWIAANDPAMLSASTPSPAALTAFYIVGSTIEVLGLVGLAIPLVRGRLQPRWVGAALVLAAILGILSFVTPISSMSSNGWLALLGAAPSVLLAIFFIEMGRRMLTGAVRDPQLVTGGSAMPQY